MPDMRWWTSDMHFGHGNICAYTERPYDNVEDMNSDLIERWNERVGPGDEVYVLGDAAMGHISQSLALVELLKGRKTLVPGNHDRCWLGLRSQKVDSVDKWTAEYTKAGFTVVPGPILVDLGGQTVTADHFPYEGDSTDEERYAQWRPVDSGLWLLHGHVHEKWRQRGRMINVGVDAWGGYPVEESDLITLLSSGPADLPRLPWPR